MERVWNTPSGQVLKQIDKVLKKSEIATIVREAYGAGKSSRGNRCYDPMILLRMWIIGVLFGLSEVETEQRK